MNLRLYFILSVVVGLQPVLMGQNLVPNGSFEDYAACPGSYSLSPAEFRVISWRSINTASPDYFNTCSKGEASVPYNWAGVSDAYEGYGYAGIYTWMKGDKDYREYLHCKLSEPLMKDSMYHIEFRYKLSSYSKFSIDRIGLLLSDGLVKFSHDLPLGIKPTFSFIQDSALTINTGRWEIAATDYQAKGNEQYLTIGNFFNNESTLFYHIQFRPESQPMLINSAYYYIDDVKVVPEFSKPLPREDLHPGLTDDPPALNTIYVLKNIQFEFNSYALLPVSYADLDKVIRYLRNNPPVNIRLSGHTDDTGTHEYNTILSGNRAESAAAYLISKGIDQHRISTFGYGETKPLVESGNEEARQVNRRVEIEFYR
jgi:OOP family OmpA-OmpF porin